MHTSVSVDFDRVEWCLGVRPLRGSLLSRHFPGIPRVSKERKPSRGRVLHDGVVNADAVIVSTTIPE